MTTVSTIANWNGYEGRSPEAFAHDAGRWLERFHPDLANVQEASRACPELRAVCRDLGYRLHRGKALGREGRSSVILVKDTTPLPHRGAIVMDRDWMGPHGHRHTGRVWPVVTAGAVPIKDVSIHMPWGQVRNQAAWRDSLTTLHKRAAGWSVPFVMMGDWNGSHTQRGPLSINRLARNLGATLVHDGKDARIDFALLRGFTDAEYETHGRYGSDTHRLGLLHLAY